jgi:hypothetical protein
MRVPNSDSRGIHVDAIGFTESGQLQDFLLPLMITPGNIALKNNPAPTRRLSHSPA